MSSPQRRRHDNFLSFAIAANKDSTLYKSPANSHFASNFRENALSGVASFRKKQRPSLAPFAAVLGKGKKLAPLGFGWRPPRILNDIDNGKGILALGSIAGMGIPIHGNLRLFE
jgi:hypothetical protein